MTRYRRKIWLFILALFLALGTGAAHADLNSLYQTFAFNDLGMHCYDADFSVFAILPPYNVVRAQVLLKTNPPIFLDGNAVTVTYTALADPAGSINRTSQGKTNFWTYVQKLFGVSPAVDVGLRGALMPGAGNTPQPLGAFDPTWKWFSAEGIPITAWDDGGQRNTLPLMQVTARNKATGIALSSLSTVVPASDEMNCSDCHVTGGDAADQTIASKYGLGAWSANADPGVQAKENILILHDAINATTLMANRPILCASCHYSAALDLNHQGPQGDQIGKPYLSRAVHGHHGKTIDGNLPDPTHPAIVTGNGSDACYQCHPGAITRCLRGAMATAGIGCQDCHGGMLAVAGVYNLGTTKAPRRPWIDLPQCQSCHTGDALAHLGGDLTLRLAYNPGDPAATPTVALNKRFAENNDTLFRFSRGHGGMACQSCHGSPHAEWPARAGANDNLAAQQIQGHTGPIIECAACHGNGFAISMDGPHGLHNVNNAVWNSEHHDFFDNGNQANCQPCHGSTLQGTPLARAAADRVLFTPGGQHINIAQGTVFSCNTCHANPFKAANRTSGVYQLLLE